MRVLAVCVGALVVGLMSPRSPERAGVPRVPGPAPEARVSVAPAQLLPGKVAVYFIRGAASRRSWALHPVYRPAAAGTPEHAIAQLLAGPSAAERDSALRTAIPAGARLLRLAHTRVETVVDLSDAGSPAAIPWVAAQVAATLHPFPQVKGVRLSVEGRAVRAILRSQFLHPTLTPALAPGDGGLSDVRPAAFRPDAPLAGKVVVISGGHGLTRYAGAGWLYQRPHFGGLVEDEVNVRFAIQAARELRALGATVYTTRPGQMTDERGVSGAPRWTEAAKYYLRDIGIPDWVHQPLPGDFDSDIDCRPLYANYRHADLLISLHNNIGPNLGTLTLYDTANGFRAASHRVAQLLHRRVVGDIRSQLYSRWRSIGVQGSPARYGENHWAQMPSVILEIGFISRRHDREWIGSVAFRQVVGRAVADAVAEYFGVSAPALRPAPPPDLVERVVAPWPAQPPVVVAVGDPTGSRLAPYLAPLRTRLAGRLGVPRYVLLAAGDGLATIDDVLSGWEENVAPARPSYVVIAVGRHDLVAAHGEGRRVPVERFEAGLTEAVRRTRALGAVPVLVTLAPIGDARFQALRSPAAGPGAGDVQEARDRYNAAIRAIARRTHARLADVSLAAWKREGEWLPVNASLNPDQPLAPAGFQRIADLIAAQIRRP